MRTLNCEWLVYGNCLAKGWQRNRSSVGWREVDGKEEEFLQEIAVALDDVTPVKGLVFFARWGSGRDLVGLGRKEGKDFTLRARGWNFHLARPRGHLEDGREALLLLQAGIPALADAGKLSDGGLPLKLELQEEVMPVFWGDEAWKAVKCLPESIYSASRGSLVLPASRPVPGIDISAGADGRVLGTARPPVPPQGRPRRRAGIAALAIVLCLSAALNGILYLERDSAASNRRRLEGELEQVRAELNAMKNPDRFDEEQEALKSELSRARRQRQEALKAIAEIENILNRFNRGAGALH